MENISKSFLREKKNTWEHLKLSFNFTNPEYNNSFIKIFHYHSHFQETLSYLTSGDLKKAESRSV